MTDFARRADTRLTLLAYVAFTLSGAAGLAYEVVWASQLALSFGAETVSIPVVLSATLAGLALGAWVLDGPLSTAARPARSYAALELVIGAWAVASTVVLPWGADKIAGLLGHSPSRFGFTVATFSLPFLALLPGAFAMGGTLVAMERTVARLTHSTRRVGGLYAANTLGAMLGVLAVAFVLLPQLGHARSLLALAALNAAAAATSLWIDRTLPLVTPPTRSPEASTISDRRLNCLLFASGMIGISIELLAVRAFSLVLENTVFTLAFILAAYLAGTALGAASFQRLAVRWPAAQVVPPLLCALVVTALMTALVIRFSAPLYDTLRSGFDGSLATALAVEALLPLAALLPVTFFMGALFSALAQARRHDRGGLGVAVGINLIGGALAPLLAMLLLAAYDDIDRALVCVALAYALLLARPPRRLASTGLVAAGLLVIVTAPQLIPDRDRGNASYGKVIERRVSLATTASVVATAADDRRLLVNDRFQMGSTASQARERLQAHVPLLIHPDPRRALFLGVGTGITFSAAADYPHLTADGVELLADVAALMDHFRPYSSAALDNTRLRMFVCDARRFVRITGEAYDVVVADLFHPGRDGAGALYTREHFLAVRRRLAAGGIFCQWLPIYQLDLPTLRLIVRTFLDVFPEASAWMLDENVVQPVLGLVGAERPIQLSFDEIDRPPPVQAALGELKMQRRLQLNGRFIGRAEVLRAWTRDALELNTDDRPRVSSVAPLLSYSGDTTTPQEWLQLIESSAAPALSGAPTSRSGAAKALRNYLRARDAYLRARVALARGANDEAIDSLLQSVKLSGDFTLAYAECLGQAWALAGSHPERARSIVERLAALRPEISVAETLLKRGFGTRNPSGGSAAVGVQRESARPAAGAQPQMNPAGGSGNNANQ